jgi:putative membrane protein
LGYVALAVCIIFLAVGIFRYVLLYRRLYKWNRVLFVDTISEKVKKDADTQIEKEKATAE